MTMAGAAHAQESGDRATNDDIVVTAQFRETRLQDTPLAITAISGEALTARSQTNIAEVAAQAPNVILIAQSPSFGPSMAASIRGIGQGDFNPAFEPGVGIYIDDVYFPTVTGSIFDLLDVERVEILRGPQGTLAGKNTIGGAIKMYSQLPNADNGGSLSVTYGIRNRLDIRGMMNVALADNLFARISGVSKRQTGYMDRLDFGCFKPGLGIPATTTSKDCVTAKDGGTNYQAVRGQLLYEPTAAIKLHLTADYTNEDRTPTAQVLFAIVPSPVFGDTNPFDVPVAFDNKFLTPFGSYYGFSTFVNSKDGPLPELRVPDRNTFDSYGFSGKAEIQLAENLGLTSITAYRDYRATFGLDGDFSPMARGVNYNDLKFHAFSQELRLNGSFGDRFVEWTLGGFYMDNKTNYDYLLDARSFGLTFNAYDVVTGTSKAAFAHATVNLTDRLAVSGGLRYNDESKTYAFNRKNLDGTPNSVLDGTSFRYSGDKWDYSANLQYRFSDAVMVYAQTSTGIKGGGISPRPFIASQALPFDPESVTSYEIGAKNDLFDRKVRLNLAAFIANYKDAQVGLSSCPQLGPAPGCGVTTNGGDARMKGVELETTIRPLPGFVIDGSLSYIDFQWTYIRPGVATISLTGRRPGLPSWKWSVGAQYEADLGGKGSLTPRVDVAYQSSFYTNTQNTPVALVDAYTLANARLTWANVEKDLSISFEVTNLFNKYYYTNKFDQQACCGQVDATVGRPREWAVTARKTF